MEIIQIIYRMEVDLDFQFLQGKDGPNDLELSKEEIEEKIKTDKESEKVLQISSSKIKKDKHQFTICGNKIRYDRIFEKPEAGVRNRIELIDKKARISKTYIENNDGKIKVYENNLDRSEYANANFSYEVSEDLEKTKEILGYKCNKLIVKESVVYLNSKEKENNRYEYYVTEEIDFPLDLLGLSKRVTNKCALEMICLKLDKGKSSYSFKAFKLNRNFEKEHLDLPEIFVED